MTEPFAYQRGHFAVEMLPPDSMVTAYDWTHGRDGNVNPVISARLATADGQVDAFCKPFALSDISQSTQTVNEVTGWLLARACNLPVPQRAFITALNLAELPSYTGPSPLPPPDQNGYVLCFATQAVAATAVRGIMPSDALVKEQAAWPFCNQTIAFDEAVANTDRHLFNLLRRRAADFVLIDHGFLLRRDPTSFPDYWGPSALSSLVPEALSNHLHHNAYIYSNRTSPSVCGPACTSGCDFISASRPLMQRALFEVAFWCSKLLPGKSAAWLEFLYSRMKQVTMDALLSKRYGLLQLHAPAP